MSSNDPLKTTIMLMPDIFVSSKPLPHPCNSALGCPNVMPLEKPSLKHPDPSIHLFSVEMLSCSKLAMKTNASFAQAKLNITNIYMKVQISDTKELLFMPATFPKQALAFTCLQNKSYGNTVRKKKCSSQAISPLPTVFSTHLKNFLPFSSNLRLLSTNSFSLESPKICCLGKG